LTDREVTWRALEATGIRRDDPATWSTMRPDHLQHLKTNPAFRAVGSERTIAAIEQVLAGQAWPMPKNWGAFFLVFPTGGPWRVPTRGWHVDAAYDAQRAGAVRDDVDMADVKALLDSCIARQRARSDPSAHDRMIDIILPGPPTEVAAQREPGGVGDLPSSSSGRPVLRSAPLVLFRSWK
jgi:hypothetical protein